MQNKSVITYIAPKDKFVRVSNIIVEKYDAEVVGLYCKIVRLSSGKSLSIDFISKHIKVSDKKVRKIVVFLESEGYIVRKAVRDERGYLAGWNYCLYAEPIPVSKRSHAGKKNEKEASVLPEIRQDGKSDKTEEGQVNILSNTEVLSNNNQDLDLDNKKVLSYDNTKNAPFNEFEKKMKERFPNIMKMEEPLTLEQAKKLKEKYDPDLLLHIMEQMDNYRPLVKKNISAYKTIINWCEREEDKR